MSVSHKPGCKGTAFTMGFRGCLECGAQFEPPEPGLSKEEAFDLHRLAPGTPVRVAERTVTKEERPFAGLKGRFIEYSTPRGFAVFAVKLADVDAAGVRDRLAKVEGDEGILWLHPESLRRVTT